MKYITAIIQAHMLQPLIKNLHECKHYPGMTVSDCEGDGRGRGPDGHYVAAMDSLFLKPRKRIEIFVATTFAGTWWRPYGSHLTPGIPATA